MMNPVSLCWVWVAYVKRDVNACGKGSRLLLPLAALAHQPLDLLAFLML